MSPEKSIDMQTRMPLRSRGRSNKPPTGLPNLDPGGSSPGGGRSDTTWSRARDRMQRVHKANEWMGGLGMQWPPTSERWPSTY